MSVALEALKRESSRTFLHKVDGGLHIPRCHHSSLQGAFSSGPYLDAAGALSSNTSEKVACCSSKCAVETSTAKRSWGIVGHSHHRVATKQHSHQLRCSSLSQCRSKLSSEHLCNAVLLLLGEALENTHGIEELECFCLAKLAAALQIEMLC